MAKRDWVDRIISGSSVVGRKSRSGGKKDWVDDIIAGRPKAKKSSFYSGRWVGKHVKTESVQQRNDYVDRIINGGTLRGGGFEDSLIRKGSVRAKGDFVDKIVYGTGARHPFTERIVNKPMKVGRIEKIASGQPTSSTQPLSPVGEGEGDKAMLPDKLINFAGKAGAAGVRTVMNLPHYYENYKAKQAASEEAKQQAIVQQHSGMIAQQAALKQAQEQAEAARLYAATLKGNVQQSQLYRDTAFRERVSQGQTPPQQQSLMQKIRGAVGG
jgi:hypothetical protein